MEIYRIQHTFKYTHYKHTAVERSIKLSYARILSGDDDENVDETKNECGDRTSWQHDPRTNYSLLNEISFYHGEMHKMYTSFLPRSFPQNVQLTDDDDDDAVFVVGLKCFFFPLKAVLARIHTLFIGNGRNIF